MPEARDVAFLSIEEAAPRIASGALSPRSLTGHMLERIERLDPHYRSYEFVDAEGAREAARIAESEIASGAYRGPLHGVPVAVKDLIDVAGLPTGCGSPMRRAPVAAKDAGVVAGLRKAGAIILGKLALAEFALSGYHPDGTVPVNAWDPDRWPGASSSGSGVAVAAGLCFAALGTDTGGSIRFPAAANGVVGLKPGHGAVGIDGIFPLAPSLDHVGPLARTAGDAALMLAAILDGFSPPADEAPADALRGQRIGVDRAYNHDNVEPEVAAGVDAMLGMLAAAGAELVEVELAPIREGARQWMLLTAVEALEVHRSTYPSRAGEYGPAFRALLDFASSGPAADIRAEAEEARIRIGARIDAALARADLLACPTMPSLPPPLSVLPPHAVLPPEVMAPALAFTSPFNFGGHPAISFPCGLSSGGLPLSAQLVAAHGDEARLIRAVRAYERLGSRIGIGPAVL
jgi:amidase